MGWRSLASLAIAGRGWRQLAIAGWRLAAGGWPAMACHGLRRLRACWPATGDKCCDRHDLSIMNRTQPNPRKQENFPKWRPLIIHFRSDDSSYERVDETPRVFFFPSSPKKDQRPTKASNEDKRQGSPRNSLRNWKKTSLPK